MEIPERHLPIMPMVLVANTDLFLEYMNTVFGASTQGVVMNGSSITSGELRVGQGVLLFQQSDLPQPTQAILYVDDVQDVYRTGLLCEGQSVAEPIITDWGFTAAFKDPFGNIWFLVQG
ncbi:MAG TPA: hypothetical protein VFV37_03405 [Luteibaculaceae bacterium]|nr:hypothetical protein [Luteibaculaceae bacterium]